MTTNTDKMEKLENKIAQLEALVDRFITVGDEGEYTEEFKEKLEQSWRQKEGDTGVRSSRGLSLEIDYARCRACNLRKIAGSFLLQVIRYKSCDTRVVVQ